MKLKLPFLVSILLAFHVSPVLGQADSDIEEIRILLDDFLEGASFNDIEMHDRFWSDELVYTGSSGQRFGKDRIMENLRNAESGEDDLPVNYSAENVNIKNYGEVILLTFRLIAHNTDTDSTDQYYNTGVFHREKGVLKAVAWQATKIP